MDNQDAPKAEAALSEYEKKRQEKIAQNQELLRHLQTEAQLPGLVPAAPKPPKKRESQPAPPAAVRASARLRDKAKREAEEAAEPSIADQKDKRIPTTVDMNVPNTIPPDVPKGHFGELIDAVPGQGNQLPFDDESAEEASDTEPSSLVGNLRKLRLWGNGKPKQLALTPGHPFSIAFHPMPEKALVFAGDHDGNFGIFDGFQRDAAEDTNANDIRAGRMTYMRIHKESRPVSSIQFDYSDLNSAYTSSYDSTIMKLDLAEHKAVQVYKPANSNDYHEPICELEIHQLEPHMLRFSTTTSLFGIHDMRVSTTKHSTTKIFKLAKKMISGFSSHPSLPNVVATASMDGTLSLWDLRVMSGKVHVPIPLLLGKHQSTCGVIHASFNRAGQVATTSYDDTVRIFDFQSVADIKIGGTFSEQAIQPKIEIAHNNQTGLHLTEFKAHWQQQPDDNIQKLAIGNMGRYIDVFDGLGEQVAQLGVRGQFLMGNDPIHQVPSVVRFHPTKNWIGGVSYTGHLYLWV